jgi:hypothetical protein
VPEYAGYAAFLQEDFDELEAGLGGIFRNFLSGVKRVMMEIVEGVVGRECFAALEFMRERLRQFLEVDRFNEQGRDGTSSFLPSPLLCWEWEDWVSFSWLIGGCRERSL